MSSALRILNEVIDERERVTGLNRSDLAMRSGVSIGTFSKMTQGINAFGLDTLERLDRDYQIAFVKRFGAEVLGLSVTELSVVDAAVAFMDVLGLLQAKARTLESVRAADSNRKAELPERESASRKVG